MNEKEGINILPIMGGGTDSATAMAMMNNNPWMYLVMLALFGGGNFGYGNRGIGAGAAALDIETQNKLNSLQAQIERSRADSHQYDTTASILAFCLGSRDGQPWISQKRRAIIQ